MPRCRPNLIAVAPSVLQFDWEMETDHELIGKVGHCTSAIEPGGMGDVMVPIRGGSESYYAYCSDPEESIPKGRACSCSTSEAPRTIIVSRY